MLTPTDYSVPLSLLEDAYAASTAEVFRVAVNQPTGNFFYDPWEIKEEYKGTVWEKLLSTLPAPIGEARVISLEPAKCYQIHADIDDRWHLNIYGEHSYLIDFNNNSMHQLVADAHWYSLDAGRLHSAANFGRPYRIQLVVRKLLNNARLKNPVSVMLTTDSTNLNSARFTFDQSLSPWLNCANKKAIISNFSYALDSVTFDLEQNYVEELTKIIPQEFRMIVK